MPFVRPEAFRDGVERPTNLGAFDNKSRASAEIYVYVNSFFCSSICLILKYRSRLGKEERRSARVLPSTFSTWMVRAKDKRLSNELVN